MKILLKLLLLCFTMGQLYAQETPVIDQINVSGTILDEYDKPFPGVSVLVKGTTNGTQTDINGNYSIVVNMGEVLMYSYVGYSKSEVYVSESKDIDVSMELDTSEEEEVVVTALGIEKKKDEIGTAYEVVDSKLLVQANSTNIIQSLQGKVSGLTIRDGNVFLRGARSMRSDNSALIVIDGVVSTSGFLQTLDPNTVKTVNVIKGANGAALYGSQASNGVLIITTKRTFQDQSKSNNSSRRKIIKHTGRLKVKNTINKAEHVKLFSKAKTVDEAYEVYNKEKENHSKELGYYVDAYDYFSKKDNSEYKKGILNDVIKSEFDNYELLRALGYKMEVAKDYLLASSLFKRVLLIRPKDAQSYRDLALVYQEMGKTQKAFELLNTIVSNALYEAKETTKSLVMYNVAKNEINNLIQKDPKVDKSSLESFNEINTNYDVRIVIDWNRADTDMDLHVIDPSLEDCFFKNPKTQIGGEISSDLNMAYGPEEFTLRNGRKGDYYVKVNYANDVLQDDENPTFVKVTLYKNYGTPKENKEVQVVRLSKRKGEQIIAKLTI